MRLSIVCAMDSNALIGTDGYLPWHLPADLRRFRKITMGHPVIMGRKTWDSLWNQPLGGRKNLVVSRQFMWSDAANDANSVRSLERALEIAGKAGDEAFIIGGASIFAATLPLSDRLYLTLIDHAFPPGDSPVYFPGGIPGPPDWEAVEEELGTVDERNPWPHVFRVLERKGKVENNP